MDEYISRFIKLISKTIVVRIYSYPQFSMEVFLAFAVCVVHFLLIFEVNTLVRRTNAKAAARLQLRHPVNEIGSCSYHSITSFRSTIYPKQIETYCDSKAFCTPFKPPRFQRKFSAASNFGWVISQGDSILRDKFHDRVEHLLSISPSEYVRRDKERKNREEGLKTCIQSLTSLLERALNIDNTLDLDHISREALKKSINTIKENFDTRLPRDNAVYRLADFPTSSLQSLISDATGAKAIQNSLVQNNMVSSIYRASEIGMSRSFVNRCDTEDDEASGLENARQSAEDSSVGMEVTKSCSSILNELYKKDYFEVRDQTESGVHIAS